jgi:hypothetical protein
VASIRDQADAALSGLRDNVVAGIAAENMDGGLASGLRQVSQMGHVITALAGSRGAFVLSFGRAILWHLVHRR